MLPRSKKKQSAQAQQMAAEIQAKEGRLRISRGTEQGIAKRREQVKEYLMRGVPKVVMAELLHVSRNTIHQDIQEIKRGLGHKIESMRNNGDQIDQEIGMISGQLATVANAAMSEYAMARTGAIKDRFLNTAAKAHWVRARLLMEVGVLPKAGEQVTITNRTEVSFESRFGKESPLTALDDPVSRRKVLTAIENVLRTSAVLPLGDKPIIDAEVVKPEQP
jgi:biotin operon repressor